MSRTLNSAEKNYIQVDKEALAIIFGIHKFNNFLWGLKITIRSNFKLLTNIFGPKKGIPLMTARQLQRYEIFLSKYHLKIE